MFCFQVTLHRRPVPKADCSIIATRRECVNEVLAAIRANTIPLASVLVYDRKLVHEANSLSLDDATASTLQLIGDFNRKYSPP